MRAIIRRTLAMCSALLVACDEDNGTGPSPSIAVSVPPVVTIQATRSALLPVNLVRAGGWKGVVEMEVVDVPAGITAKFRSQILPDHTTMAFLDVQVAYAVLPGTYTLGIHANGEAVEEAKGNLTLTVTAPPTFTLTVEPSALEYRRDGPDVTARVSIVPANGFDQVVGFTLEGPVPVGVTLPYNATSNRYVTVTVGPVGLGEDDLHWPPPGVYFLTIRGKCPGFPDQTVPLTVTVLAP